MALRVGPWSTTTHVPCPSLLVFLGRMASGMSPCARSLSSALPLCIIFFPKSLRAEQAWVLSLRSLLMNTSRLTCRKTTHGTRQKCGGQQLLRPSPRGCCATRLSVFLFSIHLCVSLSSASQQRCRAAIRLVCRLSPDLAARADRRRSMCGVQGADPSCLKSISRFFHSVLSTRGSVPSQQ